MPFTPFHFGPSACIALPLRKYIDIPVFILANVVVDIEPLVVIAFGFDYPLHGYVHTLSIGTAVGIAWAIISYAGKDILHWLMNYIDIPYDTNFKKIAISAVLGVWFHVLLDSPIYFDIHPLYPSLFNPLFGLMTNSTSYIICGIFLIPAIILYVKIKRKE